MNKFKESEVHRTYISSFFIVRVNLLPYEGLLLIET